MRTLKLFVLSIIYGQPAAFLADLLLFRMTKALANLSEARDLSHSLNGYDQGWDHLLADQEYGDPDHEEEHENEDEEALDEEYDHENYPAAFWKQREA